MTDSIHAALWEWFLQCKDITKLFFNFSTAKDADTVILTAGDTVLEEYIDGSQRRRYAFELSRYCPIITQYNDDGNIAMLEDAETIARWAQQQSDEGVLPVLPAGYSAEKIIVLDEYAGYATATNENIARYMIPFALDYMKG